MKVAILHIRSFIALCEQKQCGVLIHIFNLSIICSNDVYGWYITLCIEILQPLSFDSPYWCGRKSSFQFCICWLVQNLGEVNIVRFGYWVLNFHFTCNHFHFAVSKYKYWNFMLHSPCIFYLIEQFIPTNAHRHTMSIVSFINNFPQYVFLRV